MSKGRARNRRRYAPVPATAKALTPAMMANLPGTGTAIAVRTEAEQRARSGMVQSDRLAAYMSQAMPRDPRDLVPFGPGNPLRPAQLDPSRPDTHRAEPRLSEFEVATNLPGVAEHHIPWRVLRDASTTVDILRRCIELRKDHLAPLKWTFTVSPEAVTAAYEAKPEAGKSDLERELRQKFTPDINRLIEFWKNPWKTHGVNFAQWVRGVMEEHLVLDAVVVYPEVTYGGDVLALNLIDGSTMKPLRDYRGQRPAYPYPAYQQMLYGFPRGEFQASASEIDDDGTVIDGQGYTADQLYYYRKNFRVRSMYGFSPTEQALMSARLYLKRQGWMISEYDDGVVPEMIIQATETLSMTPKERRSYEDSLNDDLGGQTQQRHRAKILFPGMDATLLPAVDERYKPDYDMFLIKLIASHFGVSITSLGFTESKGLGSSGMHEAQADAEEIASTEPDKIMLADLINDLSHAYLGLSADVVFAWVSDEGDDTLQGEQAQQILLNSGQATVNDGRRRQGLPIFDIPEANMPFILGGTNGVTFLEGSYANQQANAKAAQAALTAGPQENPQAGDKPPTSKKADPGQTSKSLEKYVGPDHEISAAVMAQLGDDYPPESMGWIHGAHWRGPVAVPLARVDMDDRDDWAASSDPKRVSEFAQRMKAGKAKPVVLVQEPGDAKLKTVDGHHRVLAAEKNGTPVMAYVGRVGARTGPWDTMHSSQRTNAYDPADAPTSGAPMDTSKAYADSMARSLEKAAYRRFLKRPHDRAFEWVHHEAAEVAEIMKAAGEPDPKDGAAQPPPVQPDTRWPAWAVDTELATIIAGRLRASMIAGVDTSALAEAFTRWSHAYKPGDPLPNIESWLSQQEDNIAEAITETIRDAVTEAAVAGSRSAQAALAGDARQGVTARWGGWTPGHVAAARKVLSEDGNVVGLEQLLRDADVMISRIAANRLDEIAAVLADGLEQGRNLQQIATALRGVVDDPKWAMTVAWTETNRAQSAAALDTYTARGVARVEWFTANDQRVCPICLGNQTEGPIPVGTAFSSGETHPPGHPRCRCALLPVRALPKSLRAAATGNEGNAEQLHHYWTKGEGLAKWAESPHPFAVLKAHLAKFIEDEKELNATTAQWVHDGTGHWPVHSKALGGGVDVDSIDKVGPKGYIHGWIYVGPQAVGAKVFHPHHGHGTVTGHDGRTVHVQFAGKNDGPLKKLSFEGKVDPRTSHFTTRSAHHKVRRGTLTHAHETRAGLPKTKDEWDAHVRTVTAPAETQAALRHRQEVANLVTAEKKLADERAAITAEFKRKRTPLADRELHMRNATAQSRLDVELQASTVAYFQRALDDIARGRERTDGLDRINPATVEMTYPKDSHGNIQPPQAYKDHLAKMKETGHRILDDFRDAREKDATIRRIRKAYDDPKSSFEDRKLLRRAEARRESQILHSMLASIRPMGGEHDRISTTGTALPDAEARIKSSMDSFPSSWVKESSKRDLKLGAEPRANYGEGDLTLNMSAKVGTHAGYDGAFHDDVDEVNTHEMGHRMEATIPGLTAMEFTYVRERSTLGATMTPSASGHLEAKKDIYGNGKEFAYPDKWKDIYAGKTYEDYHKYGDDPANAFWEVFQTGLQDVYGRGSRNFGDEDSQAFILGALATLGF